MPDQGISNVYASALLSHYSVFPCFASPAAPRRPSARTRCRSAVSPPGPVPSILNRLGFPRPRPVRRLLVWLIWRQRERDRMRHHELSAYDLGPVSHDVRRESHDRRPKRPTFHPRGRFPFPQSLSGSHQGGDISTCEGAGSLNLALSASTGVLAGTAASGGVSGTSPSAASTGISTAASTTGPTTGALNSLSNVHRVRLLSSPSSVSVHPSSARSGSPLAPTESLAV
jgi:hypothetical protein